VARKSFLFKDYSSRRVSQSRQRLWEELLGRRLARLREPGNGAEKSAYMSEEEVGAGRASEAEQLNSISALAAEAAAAAAAAAIAANPENASPVCRKRASAREEGRREHREADKASPRNCLSA
ncbi:Hypothetical predicted protein, partial [Podarcis lilfordi]